MWLGEGEVIQITSSSGGYVNFEFLKITAPTVFNQRFEPATLGPTSHCFAIIIYLFSPINRKLMPIYRAEQSGPDQMLLPSPT